MRVIIRGVDGSAALGALVEHPQLTEVYIRRNDVSPTAGFHCRLAEALATLAAFWRGRGQLTGRRQRPGGRVSALPHRTRAHPSPQ